MVGISLQKSFSNGGTKNDDDVEPSAQLDELKKLMETRGPEAIVKVIFSNY